MPEKNKRRRNWIYGSSSLISTIFFFGILAVIALIAERHPWRMDLSESGAFTLSQQARNILGSLDKPVDIKAFFATGAPDQSKAKDLLDTYLYYSDKISYEFVDPDRHPEIAQRYGVRTYGTLVLEGYGKKESVQTASEESITNAIHKLTTKESKRIYFLTGHGERAIDNTGKDGYSNAKSALDKENYTVSALNLLQETQVPKDAAVVVVAGPQKPLFSQEIASLRSYLGEGGKVMVLTDPYHDGGLRDFAKSSGVQLGENVVIDKLSRVFGGSYLMPVVMEYGPHKITENFNVATFYPEARSVQPEKNAPEGVDPKVLASTSANAWAETNLELLKQGQASFDDKADIPGPVPLVVISELDAARMKQTQADKAPQEEEKSPQPDNKNAEKQAAKAYVLVAGNSSFADNTYFGLSGNGDFFLNMVSFLAQEENLITIEPHEKAGRPLLLTQNQARAMFWTVLVLVPLMVLLLGLSVYRVRRSQR